MESGPLTVDAIRQLAAEHDAVAKSPVVDSKTEDLACRTRDWLNNLSRFVADVHNRRNVSIAVNMTGEEAEWFETERARRFLVTRTRLLRRMWWQRVWQRRLWPRR